MDITSLYYFSELAKDLHMTRTANRLYVSQQTLSNHIQRLEEYYGTPLLYRKPRLSLTCAGEFVLGFAQTVVKEDTNLKDVLSDVVNQERGLIRIGASLPRATISLPQILPEFSARYPKVEVRFTDAISPKLEALMLDGDLDFAIVLTGEHNSKLIDHHLLSDQIYLCVPEGLIQRYYGEGAAALKEKALHGAYVEDFALLPVSMSTNRLGDVIRNCFDAAGCKPNVYFTGTYSQLLLPFCSQGLSACFITQMNLLGQWSQVVGDINIFPLFFEGKPMVHHLSLIRHRERYLSQYAKHFMNILFRVYANMEQSQLARKV